MKTTKNNVNNMDSVHIIFENLIATTLNTTTICIYKVGVGIETTKNNVNNLDCVHIIFKNLIVTTLNTITANSNIKRLIFESSLHRRRHGS